MKIFRLLAGLLTAVLLNMSFFSCSDDDDDEKTVSKNKITGRWECVSYEYWMKEDGVVTYKDNPNDYVGRAIEINEDGTYLNYFDSDYPVNATWYWKGNELWLTWSSWNDEPILEYPEVTHLDNNTLAFESKETYKEDGIKYEYYQKVVFKREKL